MFTSDWSSHTTMERSLLPNLSLLDVHLPHTSEHSNHNLETKKKEPPLLQMKNSKQTEKEADLINFSDDICTLQKPELTYKEKQIPDLQIQMLEEFLSSTRNTALHKTKTYSPEQKLQFQKFFDKYESRLNLDESGKAIYKNESSGDETCSLEFQKSDYDAIGNVLNLNASGRAFNKFKSSQEEACSSNFENRYQDIIGNPKILIPKLTKLNTEENENEIEDLIDEVLMAKIYEKRHLNNHINLQTLNNENVNKLTKISTASHANNTDSENVDIMKEVITKNPTNLAVLKLHRVNLNNHEPMPNYKENLKSNTKELVEKHNIKYLEAIKIDEKIFQKQNNLKSDGELLHLTPGPTIMEKSKILPQIIQRMTERKKAVEEKTNVQRKLILDASHCSARKETNISKTVFSTDVKNTVFNPLKKDPQLQSCSLTGVTSSGLSKTAIFDKTLGAKRNSYNNDTTNPGLKFKSDDVERSQKNRNIYFTPVKELRALKRGTNHDHKASTSGLIPPQELMNNCNKTRYVSYATSALFHDFVHGNN